MAGNVRFIRKNGRIVPIGERAGYAAKGTAAIGAGVGVAAGAAHVASRMVLEAAHQENKAAKHAQKTLNAIHRATAAGKPPSKQIKLGLATMRANTARIAGARFLFNKRNAVLSAGALGAGSLIGVGAHYLQKAATGKRSQKPSKTVTGVAAATASVGTTAIYWKKLGGGSLVKHAIRAFKLGTGIK